MGLGSWLRDPGSWIRKKPIPDPGVNKAPDPGSATLVSILIVLSPAFSPHPFFSLFLSLKIKISGRKSAKSSLREEIRKLLIRQCAAHVCTLFSSTVNLRESYGSQVY